MIPCLIIKKVFLQFVSVFNKLQNKFAEKETKGVVDSWLEQKLDLLWETEENYVLQKYERIGLEE